MMGEKSIIQGQCLCGVVRYEVEPPSLFSGHCHCSYCRRAHGAAFVTWLGSWTKQFKITTGETEVKWYHSSRHSQRGFCTICGSTLFFRSTQSPDQTHIAMANINGEVDRAPEFHSFVDQRVDWISINDDLSQLKSESPELRNYREVKPYKS